MTTIKTQELGNEYERVWGTVAREENGRKVPLKEPSILEKGLHMQGGIPTPTLGENTWLIRDCAVSLTYETGRDRGEQIPFDKDVYSIGIDLYGNKEAAMPVFRETVGKLCGCIPYFEIEKEKRILNKITFIFSSLFLFYLSFTLLFFSPRVFLTT